MAKPIKFADKRGFLTKYAHACGYMDTAAVGDNKQAITLCLDGTYHVQVSPYVTHDNKRIWDVFEPDSAGRKAARKRFMQLVKQYKAKRDNRMIP